MADRLPELIATDLEQHERLAVTLASSPDDLSQLRRKLDENRTTCPLSDTVRFALNLERAYRAMWDVFADGRPPEPIVIEEPVR